MARYRSARPRAKAPRAMARSRLDSGDRLTKLASMGTLTPSRPDPGPPTPKLLIFYRIDPRHLAAHLPPGLEPRTRAGAAILEVFYIQQDPPKGKRWLPRLPKSPGHYLDHACAVLGEGRAATWILARSASERRGRRTGALAATFTWRVHGEALELQVEGAAQEEFYLRAATGPVRETGLLGDPRAARDFLCSSERVLPSSHGPDIDGLRPERDTLALMPLSIFESRCPRFEGAGLFPSAAAEIDCAFRIVDRPRVPVTSRSRTRLRALLDPQESTPLAPGF